MELPSQLINWLYNVLQPQYIHKQLIYTHIIQFLQQYFGKGFRIRTRVYTSSKTGSSNLLINLYGKITEFNIPIEIWLPLNYPFNDGDQVDGEDGLPIIFVIPDNSNGIYLKPNNLVDSQGKFYHPFLTEWYQHCKGNNINSTNRFNLLSLIATLINSFQIENPIYRSTGPSIPPRPSKIPIESQVGASSLESVTSTPVISQQTSGNQPFNQLQQSNTGTRSTNGPPLPMKPSSTGNVATTINSRYQSPLPLPGQMAQNTKLYNSPPENNIRPYINQYPKENYPNSSGSHDQMPIYKNQNNQNDDNSKYSFAAHSTSQSPPEYEPIEIPSIKPVNIDSLMDDDNRSTFIPQKSDILNKLSLEINQSLFTLPENSSILETMNTNTLKVDGLYDQLNHHYTQAVANKEYVESHITYLTNQITNITRLNNKLDSLQDLNNNDDNHIYFPNGKISLDELVIPDSVLTNQLYDIVSEIKANKDTIGLISGNFDEQNELINDNTFDVCVKSVRNIGRDLFWLELIKHEITGKMGLST